MNAKKEQSDHYTNEYSRIRKLTSRYDIRTQSVRILFSSNFLFLILKYLIYAKNVNNIYFRMNLVCRKIKLQACTYLLKTLKFKFGSYRYGYLS